MQRSVMASLIGAVLGLVYILVNASKVPDAPAITLRILAILAFVAVYLTIRHVPNEEEDRQQSEPSPLDRRYWTVAATQFVIGIAGIAIIAGPLHHEEASVAWISLIVGVHFVELHRVWPRTGLSPLGVAISVCGLVGLVLAFANSSDESVAAVGGILPGAILLGASWWSAWRDRQQARDEQLS